MIRQPQRFAALLIGLLVLAMPAGAISVHSHPEGTSKTCTACQVLHLPGLLATAPGQAQSIPCIEPVFPAEAVPTAAAFTSSLNSRGPPASSPAS